MYAAKKIHFLVFSVRCPGNCPSNPVRGSSNPTHSTPAAPFFPPPPTNIDTADSGFPSSSSLAPTLSTHKRMLLVRACANQGRNKFFSFLYLLRSRGAFVVRKSQRRFLQSNDKIQQSFSGFTSFVRNSHEVFASIYYFFVLQQPLLIAFILPHYFRKKLFLSKIVWQNEGTQQRLLQNKKIIYKLNINICKDFMRIPHKASKARKRLLYFII